MALFWLSSERPLLKVQASSAALGETDDSLYPVVSSDTSYCRITSGCARSANVAVLQKCRTSGNADSALLPRGLLGPRTDLSKPVGLFPCFGSRGSPVRIRARLGCAAPGGAGRGGGAFRHDRVIDFPWMLLRPAQDTMERWTDSKGSAKEKLTCHGRGLRPPLGGVSNGSSTPRCGQAPHGIEASMEHGVIRNRESVLGIRDSLYYPPVPSG